MDETTQQSPPTDSVDHNWDPEKYKSLVEETQNPFLREFEDVEKDYLENKITNSRNKTFIDVGAGHGRTLPFIAPPRSCNVICVELDSKMFAGLSEKAKEYSGITLIEGSANNLSDLLRGREVFSPVVMCLQNSLGTWQGDANEAIAQMRKVAEENHGEVIISLLHQEALKNKGVEMYESLENMVGEIDLDRTDFEKGIFRSKTGYLSHWRTKEEREVIRQALGGRLISLVEHPGFSILHVSY